MERLPFDFIAEATGGRACGGGRGLFFQAVSTDTRKITPGSLFIALKGERFDGNDYLDQAFKNGAAACVAERSCKKGPVILVKDGRAALRDIAVAYRALFDIPVVGVTGSVGKTSTKEMIRCVLSERLNTHCNTGNLNNEVGLPLSVLGLEKTHEAAVFEMGMSGFGEISRLTRIAKPTMAVITNIGISHIEKLGSQENILKAKLEIAEGMKPGATMILNGDDRLLKNVSLPDMKILTYGIKNEDCGFFADNIIVSEDSTDFTLHAGGKRLKAHLPICGRHNVYNALAAYCCAIVLGLSDAEILRGFNQYVPAGLRQRVEQLDGIILIKDCYNASPDSMASAFEVLQTVKTDGRKIAVLADMLELGDSSAEAHYKVGKAAFECGADALFAYGSDARYYCEGYEGMPGSQSRLCRFFTDKEALSDELARFMKRGDAVLFKGSRGMKLEEAIEMACERWENR